MKPRLDFETQLHSVPVRNLSVKAQQADHDPAVLIVETQLQYRGLLALMAPLVMARRRRRFELAGLSRELFESLDGKRSLAELIDDLSAQHKLTFLEARALIVQYLRDLMQRGLVVVSLPEADGSPPAPDHTSVKALAART